MAIKFFKRCKVRTPNDLNAIANCIKDAVRQGVIPDRIFAEEVKGDDKSVAILYSVPKDELIKDFLRKEANAEKLVEQVIDDFYDEIGDRFRSLEPTKRKEYDKWLKKIIL